MNSAAARCGRRRPEQMTGPHPVCHDSSAPPHHHLFLLPAPPLPVHTRRREATAQRGRREGTRTHQLHRTIVLPAEVSPPAAQVLRGRAANRKTKQKKNVRGRSVGRSFGKTHDAVSRGGGVEVRRCSYMSGSCSIGSSLHFGLFFLPTQSGCLFFCFSSPPSSRPLLLLVVVRSHRSLPVARLLARSAGQTQF